MATSSGENSSKTEVVSEELECAVCLQSCIHPVKLPCSHIFCFLCVKGVANQSSRCAMCRQEIPSDFIENPTLLKVEENETSEEYQWFYEGRNGWWRYDKRANDDIEESFQKKEKFFQSMICGAIYMIDFQTMTQYKISCPGRKRKIKRDSVNIKTKGTAGLSVAKMTAVPKRTSKRLQRKPKKDYRKLTK